MKLQTIILNNVIKLMKAKELRNCDLARLLNWDQTYICKILSGKRKISLYNLEKFSEVFDIKAAALINSNLEAKTVKTITIRTEI